MARKHHHHGRAIRQECRVDRLQLRADQLGRRSARQLGVVINAMQMAGLRHAIATDELPDTISRVGRVGVSTDAYVVSFEGAALIAVYDRRGQSIAAFLPIDAPEIRMLPARPNVTEAARA